MDEGLSRKKNPCPLGCWERGKRECECVRQRDKKLIIMPDDLKFFKDVGGEQVWQELRKAKNYFLYLRA